MMIGIIILLLILVLLVIIAGRKQTAPQSAPPLHQSAQAKSRLGQSFVLE